MAPQTRTEPHSWWIYLKSFYCISTLTRPLWTILSGESDNCEIFILLLSSSSSRCCTLLFFPRFDFEKLFPLHHLLVLSISSRMLHDYYLAEMRYVHTFCFNHRLGISGGLYELLNPATWIVIALDDWLTDWMDGWMRRRGHRAGAENRCGNPASDLLCWSTTTGRQTEQIETLFVIIIIIIHLGSVRSQ